MILLTVIICAGVLHVDAQIRAVSLPATPVLYAPSGLREPATTATSSGNGNICQPDQRQYSLSQPVAMNAATQHLPFFCRQELKAEKRLGVPLRLRLGSVQYTDWLEQKPGAVAPR